MILKQADQWPFRCAGQNDVQIHAPVPYPGSWPKSGISYDEMAKFTIPTGTPVTTDWAHAFNVVKQRHQQGDGAHTIINSTVPAEYLQPHGEHYIYAGPETIARPPAGGGPLPANSPPWSEEDRAARRERNNWKKLYRPGQPKTLTHQDAWGNHWASHR